MKVLLKAVRIVDPGSPENGKTKDILIENGKILKIGKNLKSPSGCKTVEKPSLCVSPGFFDLHARFGDPGHEHIEPLSTGLKASVYGGFTGVLMMPSTLPPIHNKSVVEYLKKKTSNAIVSLEIAGTLSKNMEGKEMSEMFDMHSSGAVAFTDDKNPVKDGGLLLRALQYTRSFNGTIMSFPMDSGLAGKGQVHDGEMANRLGLQGIPEIAEVAQVTREILVAREANSPLHLSTLSSGEAIKVVKQSKKEKAPISCDVAAYQFSLTDKNLESFDSNYKVMPPLRDEKNRLQILEHLASGVIDAISSDHTPADTEEKIKEFDFAKPGMIGLETCFSLTRTFGHEALSLDQMISKLSIRPREILGLPVPHVLEGNEANLTLFSPDEKWLVNTNNLPSRCKNTPFQGTVLTGLPVAVINKGMFSWCR